MGSTVLKVGNRIKDNKRIIYELWFNRNPMDE